MHQTYTQIPCSTHTHIYLLINYSMNNSMNLNSIIKLKTKLSQSQKPNIQKEQNRETHLLDKL